MIFKPMLALVLALFLISSEALADTTPPDVIGTILEVEGKATVISGNKRTPATVDMEVRANDVLETGHQSKIYVYFIDSTEITISENSTLSLDSYVYDTSDTSDNHAVYSVLKGTFLYVSGLLAKSEKPDVTVNIPAGSIGIRGTRFWGGDLDNEYGVVVGDGEVIVDTGNGSVNLRKGEGTSLRGRGITPTPPKLWPTEKIDRARKTVTMKDPAAIGKRILAVKENKHPQLVQKHIQLQKAKLEEIRKKIESESPDLDVKPTMDELKKIRRQEKLNSGFSPLDRLNKMRADEADKIKPVRQERRTFLRDKPDVQTTPAARAAEPVTKVPARKMDRPAPVEIKRREAIQERMEQKIEDAPESLKEQLQEKREELKENITPLKKMKPILDNSDMSSSLTAPKGNIEQADDSSDEKRKRPHWGVFKKRIKFQNT